MRVIIIEDESLAATRLTRLLYEIDESIEVTQTLASVEASVQWLTSNTADLIFMDIELSDDVSFSIFKQVDFDIPVIFVTAYDAYAIQAFEQNSVAYLLKPVDKVELEKGLNKFHKFHKANDSSYHQIISELADLKKRDHMKRITVNYGGKMRSIAINDIALFYVKDKTNYLHTFQGRKYVIDQTMDGLGRILPPSFFRANRKFIVNIDAIVEVTPYSARKLRVDLNVEASEPIIISTEKITLFKKWFAGDFES